jgi:glycosyltransferase involved in cell wall biosynthesis
MRDFWLSESQPRHRWVDRLGKRILCSAAARVVANSYATAGHLPCEDKVVVVHNALEPERYDPQTDGAPFRDRHGIPFGAPLIGTVGRLRPWKGQDRFLELLTRVSESVPDVRGLIVGGSPFGVQDDYPQYLHRLADAKSLDERVVFTGHLQDVRPALAAMNVFVHPGDPEPFGLVNLEAMAMAKPVVAFAHGALPEIVIHGQTGLLVPPGDDQALAEAVVDLVGDCEESQRMGAAGRGRVESHFTAAQTVGALEATYCRLFETGGPL